MLYRTFMLTLGHVPALNPSTHAAIYRYLEELALWTKLAADPEASEDMLKAHQINTAAGFAEVKTLPLKLQAWVALLGLSILRPWLVLVGTLTPFAAITWRLLP